MQQLIYLNNNYLHILNMARIRVKCALLAEVWGFRQNAMFLILDARLLIVESHIFVLTRNNIYLCLKRRLFNRSHTR